MKNTYIKKIFLFILFFANLLFVNKIFASTLTLDPSKNSLNIGEQFYLDLMLNPEEESVNVISGKILFSNEMVSFVRAEDGGSMVSLWVEKPKQNGNEISFAGVIPNGFGGVIDPFNSGKKMEGLIIRLVFETLKTGSSDFSTSNFSLNLNDGLGTEIKIMDTSISINIENSINRIKYESRTSENPELEAYVVRDPDIFNNKYVLVFKATDKVNGIKVVRIKEGRRNWKEIESPYLLTDQSRHSSITLQATNYSGASVVMKIDKIPYDWKLTIIISFTIILILIIYIFKRKYGKQK